MVGGREVSGPYDLPKIPLGSQSPAVLAPVLANPKSPSAVSPLCLHSAWPCRGLADTAMPHPPARPCQGCATSCVSWLCPCPLETCCGHLPRAAGDCGFHTPFPLPPAKEVRSEGPSKCSPAHTVLWETHVLVPTGTEIWAMGFAGTLKLLSALGFAPGEAAAGAGHPKTGQARRQWRASPPWPPLHRRIFIYTK